MCGIVGILRNRDCRIDSVRDDLILNKMLDAVSHRGPDATGAWISDDLRVSFGHRRLSIIELSDSGNQPMLSQDERYVITFNGELYNYVELKRELEKAGSIFRTKTDTEVIIEAYRYYGDACLEHFDGMFAFAIYDKLEDKVFAARDPFGEKPFYYHQGSTDFYFASELKALYEIPGFDKSVHEEDIAKFLALQYCDGDETLFRHVKKLLPGHSLTISLSSGQFSIKRYFEFRPSSEKCGRNIDDLADEMEHLLCQSLRRRLRADVPLGVFLSGGIDSSLVAALAAKIFDRDLEAFTVGFKNWGDSEHEDAKLIADHLGLKHRVKILDTESYSSYKMISELVDEPNADTSLLPTWELCRFARQHVKVAISGDGADELFGGYGRYFACLSDLGGKLGSLGDEYYSSRILPFVEKDLLEVFSSLPLGLTRKLRSLRSELALNGLSPIDAMRQTDVQHYLPGAVLAKVDRMSMQHGLEVRTPFLNKDIAKFCEALPQSVLANSGEGKLLLKRIARRYLPSEIVDKKKRGFGLPGTKWGEQELLEFTRTQVVASGAKAWWVDSKRLDDGLTEHSLKSTLHPYRMWSLLHLNGYIQHNSLQPAYHDSVYPWLSLKATLTEHRNALVLTHRPLSKELKRLLAGMHCISSWEDGRYCEELDWARNLPAVICSQQRATTQRIDTIVLHNSFELVSEHESELKALGISQVYWCEGGQWKGKRLVGYKKVEPLSNYIFNSYTGKLQEYSRQTILSDLWFTLTSIVRRSEFGCEKESYQLKSGGRFDIGTPRRAWKILLELKSMLSYFRQDRLFQKVLRRAVVNPQNNTLSSNLDVLLIVPSLYHGGAERQLVNIAVGLKHRQYHVKVLTLQSMVGGASHYAGLLQTAGIEVVEADSYSESLSVDDWNRLGEQEKELLQSSNIIFTQRFKSVFNAVLSLKPRASLCFLDVANCSGGLASILAGVGKVVLSFRNENPTHFSFNQSWYKNAYQLMSKSDKVVFCSNSERGTLSYANWLGINTNKIHYLPNAVIQNIGPDNRMEIRARYKIESHEKLILGVFRLSPEKRPLLFIEIIAKMKELGEPIKALIVGEGPLRPSVEEQINRLNLQDTISLAGVSKNVGEYYAASDALLHCSEREGTPNVVLEALQSELPVVVSKLAFPFDGAVEFANVIESDSLSDYCNGINEAFAKNKDKSRLAKQWVDEHFGLEKMLNKAENLLFDKEVRDCSKVSQ